ncbi:class F sortase [Nocardioides guangzhouensis]|uniref:Class F sortase n=2 Tax=Nocardioides guangzhouensis TaxID=2497878 RepID=A0A4Q4Z1W7_9ACTN|nr:class F sortase [Nocardioides guangzhouensis]RYP81617.1 class F sortase [Nocardioides guangzhouensis]
MGLPTSQSGSAAYRGLVSSGPGPASAHGHRVTRPRRVVAVAVLGAVFVGVLVLAGGTFRGATDHQERPDRSTVAGAVDTPSPAQPSPPASAPGPTRPGRPVRLEIPVLALDAPVVPISLGADRVLVPPADTQVLGWWSGGAQPGAARGSALITGHTVHTGGGVFDDLARVHKGDLLRVRTTTGTLRYRASSVRVYRKASLAQHAERVFSQAVPGRLVLINCADWNGAVYLSNTVVTAAPSA